MRMRKVDLAGWHHVVPYPGLGAAEAMARVFMNAWLHKETADPFRGVERLLDLAGNIGKTFEVDLSWLEGLEDRDLWNLEEVGLDESGKPMRRPRISVSGVLNGAGNVSVVLSPYRRSQFHPGDFRSHCFHPHQPLYVNRPLGEVVWLREAYCLFNRQEGGDTVEARVRSDVMGLFVVAYENLVARVESRFPVVRATDFRPVLAEGYRLGGRVSEVHTLGWFELQEEARAKASAAESAVAAKAVKRAPGRRRIASGR